jgi:hypothetical protein
MRVNELALSQAVLPSLAKVDSLQYPSRARLRRLSEGFVHVPGAYCTPAQTYADLAQPDD